MTHSLYILRDDDFDAPIYADPAVDELDEDVWDFIVNTVHEAVENEGPKNGVNEVQEHWIGWKMITRAGLSFVVVLEDEHDKSGILEFLADLSSHYMGEVDDIRFPDTDGLEDVLVDVIAPWDE